LPTDGKCESFQRNNNNFSGLQHKVARICDRAGQNIFEMFIRCDLLKVAQCQWKISKTKRLAPVCWLLPADAIGFQKFEIPMPNPAEIISARPAPKRCPSDLKERLQGIPWQQAFAEGQNAFDPIFRVYEESKNFAVAKAKGNAGFKPETSFVSIRFPISLLIWRAL